MFKIFGFNSTYPKQEDSGTHLFIVGVEQPVFRLFSSHTVLPACGPPEVPVNPTTANYKKKQKSNIPHLELGALRNIGE